MLTFADVIKGHAEYNGLSLILIVSTCLAVYALFKWTRLMMIDHRIPLKGVFHSGVTRILIGIMIMFISLLFSRLMWFPYRAIVISQNSDTQEAYNKLILFPSILTTFITVAGLGIVMWPMMKHNLGKCVWLILPFMMIVIYSIGYYGTFYLAGFF